MVWNIVSLIIECAMAVGLVFAIRILKRLEKADEKEIAKEEAAHEQNIEHGKKQVERSKL